MIECPIDDRSFLQLAMHHYDNPQCVDIGEFEEDLKRFSYLKKLFYRYAQSGDLKEQLIINHLIILFNLFGLITVEFLFFKIDKAHWSLLATFLLFLDRLPTRVPEVGISTDQLAIDTFLLKRLKEL